MQQLHTANADRKGPTQADLRALKAKVEQITANRQASPPTQAEINHQIRRETAGLIVDLQEAGFDTREVEANLLRLTTNAADPDAISHDLPDFDGEQRTTNASTDPAALSHDLPE